MRAASEAGRAFSNRSSGSTKCESAELAQILDASMTVLSVSVGIGARRPELNGVGPKLVQRGLDSFGVELVVEAAEHGHPLDHAAEGFRGDAAVQGGVDP